MIENEMLGGNQTQTPSLPDMPVINPDSGQLLLDSKMQKMAVSIVTADFESAKLARDQRTFGTTSKGEDLHFDEWLKQLKDLYYGNRLPKTLPWRHCANRSLLIAMAILDTLHARLFPAVWNENMVRWRPAEDSDAPRAESIEKLMFWWVKVRCRMRDFFDKWTRYTIGFGRCLTESTWDVMELDKGEVGQSLGVDPATGQPLPPEKVLSRIERSVSWIVPEDDIFLPEGATDIQRDPVVLRKRYFYRDLEEMERKGQAVNVNIQTTPDSVILKDRLPVSMPEGSSDLSPEAMEEMKAIRRRNMPVEVLVWYGGIDLDSDGFPEQVRIVINKEWQTYLGGVALRDITARGLRHLDMTLFEPRIDDPHSLQGIGILEKVKELAQEIDAIFNQLTDAHTMMVLRPGFYDPGGNLNVGELTLAPNRWTGVSNPQQSIYVPEFNVATEKLILAMRTVLEFIERLTGASAYVMGRESEIVGGSGTATRTQAIVGAANERHAVPAERLREGVARLMTHHLDLLQKNRPPGLEHRVLGSKNEPIFANEVSEEAVAGEFDAYLLPDDSMGSKESGRELAQLLWSLAMQNPLVAQDPAKLYRHAADVYKAWGKDPEVYMGPEPPIDQLRSPEEEHNLMVQGDFSQVKASLLQNPIEHIMKHMRLPQDPLIQSMPPILQQQVLAFLQAHIQEHTQLMQVMMQMSKTGKPTGGIPQSGGSNGNGQKPAQVGSPGVGPEPGMGSVQQPRAAAGQAQKSGESIRPS